MEKTLLKNFYPTIDTNTNYYFIKTCNGRFYSSYIENKQVGLYPVMKTEEKKWGKDYNLFTSKLQVGDLVIIPSMRNKIMQIGKITSPYYIEDDKVYRLVEWFKELNPMELLHIHPYLHSNHIIMKMDNKAEIERCLYQIFGKEESYHFILKVTQVDNILCKSLFGLYHLLLEEAYYDHLKIKITLQSPGMIELITDHIEVILTIIKVLKIIYLIRKRQQLTSPEEEFMKENKDIIDKYYTFSVDQLKLEAPVIDDSLMKWLVKK